MQGFVIPHCLWELNTIPTMKYNDIQVKSNLSKVSYLLFADAWLAFLI
uniref:Uncharacterized protein n=1 Tax=Rhizophora mucronata TaxID=61149 RepID=A0A2P2K472_RHIMU